ncbi:pyridoxamine 5'-phosphate oxidase family protein [Clostridium ihumii]|uniref:pyridoxamine 5'-phosphate oxidase family protein n=1 Tax=Clostridium ihumii TaxID=1470356 RepID=UPI003D3582C7
MEKLLKFLNDSSVFYLATMEGNMPRVRPFGFSMIYDNKLYFLTNTEKNVYKQLEKNPSFEICALSPSNEWIRINGQAKFDNDNLDAKKKVFEIAPDLLGLYESPENPKMSLFYLSKGSATVYSMKNDPKLINF